MKKKIKSCEYSPFMSNTHANPFESGHRKVIPAVLSYLFYEDQVLMIHRQDQGFHEGKWNGLGGKLELDESPLEAVQRETFEESGLKIPKEVWKTQGIIQFPNFKPHKNEDWIVYIFSAHLSSYYENLPQIMNPSHEGTLHWISKNKISSLNLWPGDFYFIPFILAHKKFVGTIWYENSKVERHWLEELNF